MPNVVYSFQDRRNKNRYELSSQHIDRILDSLANNLMGMVLLMQLSLNELEEENNLDNAKRELKNAVQAGNYAMKLMRTVLNSQKTNPLDR